MYSDLIPSFLRQNTPSVTLRKQWKALLLIADHPVDSAYLKALNAFIDCFVQALSSSQLNFNDIAENGNISIFQELLKFVQTTTHYSLHDLDTPLKGGDASVSDVAEVDIAEIGRVSTSERRIEVMQSIAHAQSFEIVTDDQLERGSANDHLHPATRHHATRTSIVSSEQSVEDNSLASSIIGTRNKVLIVMDMLLKTSTCQQAIIDAPHVVTTLKSIISSAGRSREASKHEHAQENHDVHSHVRGLHVDEPQHFDQPLVSAIETMDQIWILRMISKLACKERNILDLIADQGLVDVLDLLEVHDSDMTAEIVNILRILMLTGVSAFDANRVVTPSFVRTSTVEVNNGSKLVECESTHSQSSNSLLFTKVVSAVGDLMKLGVSKTNSRSASKSDKPVTVSVQQRNVVLSNTFLHSDAARVRTAVEELSRKKDDYASMILAGNAVVSQAEMEDLSAQTEGIFAFDHHGDDSTTAEPSPSMSVEQVVKTAVLQQGALRCLLRVLESPVPAALLLQVIEVLQLILDDSQQAQLEFSARMGYDVLLRQLTRDLRDATSGFYATLFTLLSSLALFCDQPRQVSNFSAIEFFVRLLESERPCLVDVAVKLFRHILQTSPSAVVVIEAYGASSSLSAALSRIVLTHSLSPPCKSTSSGDPFESFHPEPRPSSSYSAYAPPPPYLSSSPPSQPVLTSAAPEETATAEEFEALVMTSIELIKLLQQVAVITSLRDTEVLAFLVSLLFLLTKKREDFYSFSHMCQNCEKSRAQLECIHPACVLEGCFCLCSDCDTVFHRAVLRRNHFRLPICSSGSMAQVLQLMNPNVLRDLRHNAASMKESSRSLVVLCVLLNGVRGLVDDRRAREQHLPSALLEPIVIAQRAICVNTIGIADSTYGSLQECPDLWKLAQRFADYRDDTIITPGENIEIDEPAESANSNLVRVAAIMMAQILSRFFVSDILKTVEWTDCWSPFDSLNSQLPKHKCDHHATRFEAIQRVRSFRSFGGDALLAFMVNDNSGRLQLTSADKQFMVWLLREAIVCSLDSDTSQAYPIMCWVLWLISPPLSFPDSAVATPAIIHQQEDAVVYATFPYAKLSMSPQLRLFVLQEIRMLLGGDDWEGVLPRDLAIVPSKTLLLPWSAASEALDLESRASFNMDLKQCMSGLACPFRIPVSSALVKELLVEAKVVQLLCDMLFSATSGSDGSRTLAAVLDPLSSPESRHERAQWWCALSCLSALVAGSDDAKGILDSVLGIETVTTLLLPLANSTQSQPLAAFLTEICVENGRVIPPARPFHMCCKLLPEYQSAAATTIKKSLHSPDPSPTHLVLRYYMSTFSASSFVDCIRPKELMLWKQEPTNRLASLQLAAVADDEKSRVPKYARTNSESEWETWSNGSRLQATSNSRSFQDVDVEFRSSNSRRFLAYFHDHFKRPNISTLAPSIGGDNMSLAEESHTSIDYTPFSPFLSSLEWGLTSYLDLTYQLFQESLLAQSGLPSDLLKDKQNLKNLEDLDTSRQRLTLARKHYSFIYPRGSQFDSKIAWKPSYSKLRVKSSQLGTVLLALAVATIGSVQTFVLTVVSNLLESPYNSELLTEKGLPLNVMKLISKLDESQKPQFGFLLSQLLRYSISPSSLRELLRLARQINGQDVIDKLNKFFPSKHGIAVSESSMNEILFIIGRAVECASPSNFVYFPASDPFSTRVSFPRLERFSQAKSGFSLCCWLRLGNMAEYPVSSFVQMYSTDSNPGATKGSSVGVLDLFFRVVYKPGSVKDTDSLISGVSAMYCDGTLHEESRRVLQLCISVGGNMSVSNKEVSDERWAKSMDLVMGQGLNLNAGSKDNDILSSLMKFAIPDAIVDLDWVELGDWHLLCLSWTAKGIQCHVDGKSKRVLKWTQAGYTDDFNTVPFGANSFFPPTSKECPLRVSLGGLRVEKGYFAQAVSRLAETERQYKKVPHDIYVEMLSARELSVLQIFKSRVSSFVGFIGEFAVIDGAVSQEWMSQTLSQGVSTFDYTTVKAHLSLALSKGVIAVQTTSSRSNIEDADAIRREESHNSSRFAIFSSGVSERTELEGEVQRHCPSTIAETMEQLGGIKVWYPLLTVDKARQVTALRSISYLLSSSSKLYDDFFTNGGDKVVLFCLHNNQGIMSLESMQVLFDIVIPNKVSSTSADTIDRVKPLKLLCDVACASARRIQLARSTLDWLKGICDDVVENSSAYLEQVGLYPLLIMLSIWNIGEASRLCGQEYDRSISFHNNSVEFHRLQASSYRFLRQLMTGTSGEQSVSVPSSSTTTGFNSTHMAQLFGFVSFLASNRSHHTFKDDQPPVDSKGQSAGIEVLQTTAIQFAVDSIIDASDGPLAATISSILKYFCTANALWFFIMDLLSIPNAAIRNRALQMLRLGFTLPNGKIDLKNVIAFERVNGFVYVADRLSVFPWDPVTMELMLDMLFWRGKRGAVNLSHETESVRSKSESGDSHDEELHLDEGLSPKAEEVLAPSETADVDALAKDETPPPEFLSIRSMLGWKTKKRKASSAAPSSPNGKPPQSPVMVHTSPPPPEEQAPVLSPEPGVEKIAIPQFLIAIFTMLQASHTSSQVVVTLTPIQTAVSMPSDLDEASPHVMKTIQSNISAFCSQKDWLLSLCKALFHIHQRLSREIDMPAYRDDMLREHCDPFYNLIQRIFADDMRNKPSSSRKVYEVFRIVNSKFKFLQLVILFDLLEAIEACPLNDIDRAFNLLRNFSSVLDNAIDKIESLPLEFIVKAIHMINVVSYRSPHQLRLRLKDTGLPDSRNVYVTHCLVWSSTNYEDFSARVSVLVSIQSSIQNMLASDSKQLPDFKVVAILLGYFTEATDLLRGIEAEIQPGEYYEILDMQIAVVELVQMVVTSSMECRKTLSRLCMHVCPHENKGIKTSPRRSKILLASLLNSFRDGESFDAHMKESQLTSVTCATGVKPVQTSKSWFSWSSNDNASATSLPDVNDAYGQFYAETGYGREIYRRHSFDNDLESISSHSSGRESSNSRDSSSVGAGRKPPASPLRESSRERARSRMSQSPSVKETEETEDEATPSDTAGFIAWFNDEAQSDLRQLFKINVLQERNPILYTFGKANAKLHQKQAQYVKALLEKDQKEKDTTKRLLRETKDKCDDSNLKRANKFDTEVNKWISGLLSRVEGGSTLFYDYIKGATNQNERADPPFPSHVAETLKRLGAFKSQEEPLEGRTPRGMSTDASAQHEANAVDVNSWRELFTFMVKYLSHKAQA